MKYDVIVVGAGVGGLTTAALLAARGLSVCLFEKESAGGGCASVYERFGYRFEQGASLYAAWHPEGIHQRIFTELRAAAPEVRPLPTPYVVRLKDSTDVRVGGSEEEFFSELGHAFPECAAAARRFYGGMVPIADALRRIARLYPALLDASRLQRIKLLASEPRLAPRVLAAMKQTAEQHIPDTSVRFRDFIDAQLRLFAGTDSSQCAYLYAALALTEPLRGMYALRGGAQSLARALSDAFRQHGGTLRFDTTVLRLAYETSGEAVGVDLLSGERVEAARAIVSNLTVWDTYGKLVGLNRTPASVRSRLKRTAGRGAYLLYLGLEEETAARLASERIIALGDRQPESEPDTSDSPFLFSAAPDWDPRAPEGRRAVTVTTITDAEEWFTFHEDEAEHEAQDQAALERVWGRLHAAMPELGDGVEVIDTATPRTFYERTRRRLGMVGGTARTLDALATDAFTHRTSIPNLYMVGDTVFPGQGLAAVTHAALIVANEIAPPN